MLHAFGVDATPGRLPGGRGTSWRAGELVLKPDDGPVHAWLAAVLRDVVPDGFRLAVPVPTLDARWAQDGWTAAPWLDGTEPEQVTPEACLRIIDAGRAFHRAVAHLARPAVLDDRTDWWAVSDRVAWGEQPLDLVPDLADVARRLRGALAPLGPPQLVHTDLTGNVLLHPTLPPAIIDVSPGWRPTAFAEGVVIADALCWHDAPPSLLERAGVSVPSVARALLFRVVTTSQAVAEGAPGVDLADEVSRYELAAEAIGCGGGRG